MKLNELPVWEKPREKMLRDGVQSLSTAEVIAVVLRTGTQKKSAIELATEVLSMDRRGLRHLAECTPEELCSVHGLGEAKACELLAAIELGKRLASQPPEHGPLIRKPEDIAGIFMEKLRYEKREHFKCLLVNARGEVIEENEISVGDLTSSTSHPREVFHGAIRRSAGSVAFVHNHPSGNPEPSPADIETTRRLVDAGQLLGIPVIDHIIIGDGEYVSMKGRGLL